MSKKDKEIKEFDQKNRQIKQEEITHIEFLKAKNRCTLPLSSASLIFFPDNCFPPNGPIYYCEHSFMKKSGSAHAHAHVYLSICVHTYVFLREWPLTVFFFPYSLDVFTGLFSLFRRVENACTRGT